MTDLDQLIRDEERNIVAAADKWGRTSSQEKGLEALSVLMHHVRVKRELCQIRANSLQEMPECRGQPLSRDG